ncbi:abortive infection protein [Calothrix sp. NIES-4071]|nr:abortive infection protein [Calothrix sp. NIES-4071]BAZ54773.1 abortive infection protein [Calothrix sp. NIES-4105]
MPLPGSIPGLLAAFGAGINEEIWFRLGVLTALVGFGLMVVMAMTTYIYDDEGADTIDGGAGSDYLELNLSASTSDLSVSYNNTNNTYQVTGGTSFKNIERLNLTTGSGNDNINLANSTNRFRWRRQRHDNWRKC